MKDERKERLEAIQRELEKQYEAWDRVQALAARLGDVEIAVPRDVLDQIAGSNPEPAAPITGVRV